MPRVSFDVDLAEATAEEFRRLADSRVGGRTGLILEQLIETYIRSEATSAEEKAEFRAEVRKGLDALADPEQKRFGHDEVMAEMRGIVRHRFGKVGKLAG